MIKKLFAAIFVFAASLFLFACNDNDYDAGVSQLRTDILFAEADGAEITVYLEERELPLVADGAAGARTPVLIVKIVDSAAFSGTYTITVSYDGKEYTATPELRGELLSAVITVDALPSNGNLDLALSGERELSATLHTALPEHASAEKAISAAKAALGDRMIYDGKKLDGELFVRVLSEEGNAFWYVGYITESETISILISGDGENVLAEHVSPTRN